jgi:hypothetical protein
MIKMITESDLLGLLKAFGPTARSVIDAQYLNDISLQSIGDNEGRLGDDELARARDAAGAPDLRIVGKELFDIVYDVKHDPLRDDGVVFRDIGLKRTQVFDCLG